VRFVEVVVLLSMRFRELVARLNVRFIELVTWLACAPSSWTRAGHLAAKILHKHARIEAFDSPALSTRALLHIFHRDEPDSSHCSLLGLSSPRAGMGSFCLALF
jgi:hypothetical protein